MDFFSKAKYFLGENISSKLRDLASDTKTGPSGYPLRSKTGFTLPYFLSNNNKIGIYNPSHITYNILKEMETYHQIHACLLIIMYSMFSFNVYVEGEDLDIVKFASQKIMGENLENWRNFLAKVLRSSQAYGVYIGEKIFLNPKEEKDGQVIYKKIKDLEPDPSFLRIYINKDREYMGIGYMDYIRGDEVFIEAQATFRYTRYESFGNYWGFARTIPAYTPWYHVRLAEMFAARFVEQKVTLPFKGYAPEGKTRNEDGELVDNRILMSELMMKLRDNDGVCLPFKESKGGKLEFDIVQMFDSQGASSVDAFVEYIRYLNTAITRSMLGPDKYAFQEPGTGALASAEKYGELGELLIFGEFELICAEATKYWLNDPIRLTFGKNAPLARIVPEKPDKDHQKFLRDVFRLAVKTGSATPALDELAKIVKIPYQNSNGQTPRKVKLTNGPTNNGSNNGSTNSIGE